MFDSATKIKLQPNKQTFTFFSNTALYSPLAYFPQSTGIFIGRLFGLPPLLLLYLARIFNLATWIVLVYFALKTIPFNKWLFLALALTPMSLHIAASASVDTYLNGLVFLYLAVIFRIAFDENAKIGREEFILLAFLTLLIGLSKNIYVILAGLIFLIPKRKTGNTREYLKFVTVQLGTALFVFTISSLFVNHLVGQIHPVEQFYSDIPNVPKINPSKQIQFILTDFTGFIALVINSYKTHFQLIAESFIGYLGWMEQNVGKKYYVLAYITLFFLALTSYNKTVHLKLTQRALIITLFIIVIIAFSFTMFCSWTEPGATLISNLQGRYFIPVAPLLFTLMFNNQIRVPDWFSFLVVIGFILISYYQTFKVLLLRFYF